MICWGRSQLQRPRTLPSWQQPSQCRTLRGKFVARSGGGRGFMPPSQKKNRRLAPWRWGLAHPASCDMCWKMICDWRKYVRSAETRQFQRPQAMQTLPTARKAKELCGLQPSARGFWIQWEVDILFLGNGTLLRIVVCNLGS